MPHVPTSGVGDTFKKNRLALTVELIIWHSYENILPSSRSFNLVICKREREKKNQVFNLIFKERKAKLECQNFSAEMEK